MLIIQPILQGDIQSSLSLVVQKVNPTPRPLVILLGFVVSELPLQTIPDTGEELNLQLVGILRVYHELAFLLSHLLLQLLYV